MNKKGYFFVIDAFIALMILTVGVYIIINAYIDQLEKDQPAYTSKTLMTFMSNISIGRYNSDYKFDTLMDYQVGRDSVNFIRRYENTIIEQLGEFYYREKLRPYPRDLDGLPFRKSFSEGLADDVIKNLVPPQYEVEVLLHDPDEEDVVSLYKRNDDPLYARENAALLIPTKAIIMGDFEDTETSAPIVWGPYVLEVHIWQ
jgi:hypothetical protein